MTASTTTTTSTASLSPSLLKSKSSPHLHHTNTLPSALRSSSSSSKLPPTTRTQTVKSKTKSKPQFSFTGAPEGYYQSPLFTSALRSSNVSNGLFLFSPLTTAGPGSYETNTSQMLKPSPSITRLNTQNRRVRDCRPLVGSAAALSLYGGDRLLYEEGPDMNKYEIPGLSFTKALEKKAYLTSNFASESSRFTPTPVLGSGLIRTNGIHEKRIYHRHIPKPHGHSPNLDRARHLREKEALQHSLVLKAKVESRNEDGKTEKDLRLERSGALNNIDTSSKDTKGRAITPAFESTITWDEIAPQVKVRGPLPLRPVTTGNVRKDNEFADLFNSNNNIDVRTYAPGPAQFKMFGSWKNASGSDGIRFEGSRDRGGFVEDGLIRPWSYDNEGDEEESRGGRSRVKFSRGGGGDDGSVLSGTSFYPQIDFINFKSNKPITNSRGSSRDELRARLRKNSRINDNKQDYSEGQFNDSDDNEGKNDVERLEGFKQPADSMGLRFY